MVNEQLKRTQVVCNVQAAQCTATTG